MRRLSISTSQSKKWPKRSRHYSKAKLRTAPYASAFRQSVPFRFGPIRRLRRWRRQFLAPNGQLHKIEILGDGQQIVVNGIHPDTHKPYRWHGGEPGPKLRREDLPLITAETAAAFIAAAAEIMRSHGWKEVENRKSNGTGKKSGGGAADHGERAPIRERAYAQAALDGCAEELAATPAGGRNEMLNKKSFRLGTMVARSWLARAEVEAALSEAMAANGYVADKGSNAVEATLRSGLDAGSKEPHPDLPDQPGCAAGYNGQERSHPRAAAWPTLMPCSKNGWATNTTSTRQMPRLRQPLRNDCRAIRCGC